MNLKKILNERYSTKEFDPDKKISEKDFEQLKSCLQMSPSSLNLQPWHFVVATTDEGKQRIAKGTDGEHEYNKSKVLNASHVVLYSTRLDADDDYIKMLLEQEDRDGRYKDEEKKENMHNGRKQYCEIHRTDMKDMSFWLDKQVYLNMGMLLLGAAALGIDACPMEGVNREVVDEEFGLREKGYSTIGLVALGYHKPSDFNAELPKSRLPESKIITFLD
ncbi:MAG: oxygen-insensitive NAD(P)H nitroreductase [Cyclobacteriaceae bacterium]